MDKQFIEFFENTYFMLFNDFMLISVFYHILKFMESDCLKDKAKLAFIIVYNIFVCIWYYCFLQDLKWKNAEAFKILGELILRRSLINLILSQWKKL